MKKLFIFLITFISLSVYSQQEAQFTQNSYAILPFNPGYAGTNDAICASTLFRQQWAGFKDKDGTSTSPQDILFMIDAPISILRGGVGLSILKDKIGYEDNVNVKLAYSYKLLIGREGGFLGIGAQVGFLNKTIDFTKFVAVQEDDPRLLGKGKESDMFTDVAFGLFYKVPNQYYAGISTTQILQNSSDIKSTSYKLKRHYFLTGGYEYIFPSLPDFVFEPSLLIKTDFASAQYDLSVISKWNNRVWGGLSYRLQDAVSVIIGGYPFTSGTLKDLRIGYSYDITTSKLGRSGRSFGSHEVMIKYCFRIVRTPVVFGNKNPLLLGN